METTKKKEMSDLGREISLKIDNSLSLIRKEEKLLEILPLTAYQKNTNLSDFVTCILHRILADYMQVIWVAVIKEKETDPWMAKMALSGYKGIRASKTFASYNLRDILWEIVQYNVPDRDLYI